MLLLNIEISWEATNPENADEGTIRKIHALNIQENLRTWF